MKKQISEYNLMECAGQYNKISLISKNKTKKAIKNCIID